MPPPSTAPARCRRFWYIELPLLRQTSLLVASLATINAFQSFVLQFVLSSDQGGPANSTLVLGLLVFKYGFQYFRMGDAAAVSVVMFAIIMSVTLLQLWLGRRALLTQSRAAAFSCAIPSFSRSRSPRRCCSRFRSGSWPPRRSRRSPRSRPFRSTGCRTISSGSRNSSWPARSRHCGSISPTA